MNTLLKVEVTFLVEIVNMENKRKIVFLKKAEVEDETTRRKAWEYAFGIIKVDGLVPSDDLLELAEREIRGEITTADIKIYLDNKYKK